MRVIEVPHRVVVNPLDPNTIVGHHVATVEDEISGKRYAYVEQWPVPWRSPQPQMIGFGAWDIKDKGTIDFSRMSDALSEVVQEVEKAGLKHPARFGRT